MKILNHPARWIVAFATLALATMATAAPALAEGDPSPAIRPRFQVHGARLHPLTGDCAASGPHGSAISRQAGPAAAAPRASLAVKVADLRCAAGKVRAVVVVNENGRHPVGRIEVNEDGNGRAFYMSSEERRLPRISEGDRIFLYDVNAEEPLMGGRFQRIRLAADDPPPAAAVREAR